MRVSDFGYRVSGGGFRVEGFDFRVSDSGLGFRVLVFDPGVSVFRFRISGFGFRFFGLGAQVLGRGLRGSNPADMLEVWIAMQTFTPRGANSPSTSLYQQKNYYQLPSKITFNYYPKLPSITFPSLSMTGPLLFDAEPNAPRGELSVHLPVSGETLLSITIQNYLQLLSEITIN